MFAPDLGYKIISHHTPWRFHIFTLEKDHQKFFAKMSTDQSFNLALQNEVAFYKQLTGAKSFRVPEIIDTGTNLPNLFFYISNLIDTKSLDIDNLDLNKIADIILEIKNSTLVLPKDGIDLTLEKRNQLIIEKLKLWMSKSKYNCSPLYNYFYKRLPILGRQTIHGDLAANHILVDASNSYWCIDPEHASSFGGPDYDTAYFFHRLYTKQKRPDLAEVFLRLSQNFIDPQGFLASLSYKLIGGWMDLEYDQGQTDRSLQLELTNKFLKNDII